MSTDDLSRRIAALSPAKQALLALRLQGRERTAAAGQGIPRRPGRGPAPLSFAQQRLWFLDQLEPDSPLYNITRAFRIRGPLDAGALRGALDSLIARHESLRTTFVATDGEPAQVIAEGRPAEMAVSELPRAPEGERAAEVQRLLSEEARRPFALSRDPMLRAILLRLGAEDHVLCVTIHHIVSDWWSMRILMAELGTLYGSCLAGAESPLPELPIQYADYAVWQRDWLRGEVLERQLAHWRRHLGGAPPALELPTDRPRPAVQTYRGARESLMLPGVLMDALQELARREGATLFMMLLAAYQTLLHRYTDQCDLVVGSPIAGRTRLETEGLIGFFVNTLALRADLSANPSFLELLRRVREVALGAYAHQDIPFERLVEELAPQRDLSRAPIVQVSLVLQDSRRPILELHGLTVDPMDVHNGTSKFDLSLTLVPGAAGTQASVEYSTDLFDAATMTRLLGHFRTLLEGVVADPAQRISDLPLLTEAERHRLLVAWNDTRSDYPREACVHHLIEAQVERTPDAVAVTCQAARLTYRELNGRANRVAHALRCLGVKPEVLVGVCVERSPEMVVALLGILKAGGAYVPIDPSYPPERLAFMLADARAPVLLTQRRLASRVAGHEAQVIYLDEAENILDPEGNPIDSDVRPDNLAYVIYTSGSTGKPKGAMITHRGLVNYLMWCATAYAVAAGEGAPVHSSISFDLTVTGLFGPLLVGRRVDLLPEHLGIEALCAALRTGRNYSLVKITPTHLDLLGRQFPASQAGGRTRAFIIGGENLLAETLAFWQAAAPDTVLVNEYGPTETVVGCCVYQVPPGKHSAGAIPIGRPIANTQLYVLDRHRQPVPIGVPGELYIGGDGVARGYLSRPELTAERFVPNPFSAEPGARLYRTGDRVRYLPDGNLEFLGRFDDQVKLRGFRIELGEVEVVLAQLRRVREAAVVVREDSPGEKRLVAYLVPAEEGAPSGTELRHFLRQKLPDYMVPAAFVVLEALPLTPNGKVDPRALPPPDGLLVERDGVRLAPRDPLEVQLTQIWENVLGIRPIGVRDSFFDVGGHSLLAVRLLAAIAKHTGKELPLATLFRAPTIEGLAGILRQEGWSAPWTALVPLQPGGSRPPLFCVHQHHGHTYWAQPLAQHLGPDQPVFGLAPRGLDGREAPWTRIEEMAGHYVREIRALQPAGPYHLAGYCFGGTVAFEIAHQLLAEGQAVDLLALIEASWREPGSPPRRALQRLRRRIAYETAQLRRLTAAKKVRYLVGKGAVVAREQAARLVAKLDERRRGGPSQDTYLDRAIRRVEEAHGEAVRQYRPKAYPGRVTHFRHARPSARRYGDPTWGWGGLAGGGIEIWEIPGERPTVVDEPDVQLLAERLRACLEAAQTPAIRV